MPVLRRPLETTGILETDDCNYLEASLFTRTVKYNMLEFCPVESSARFRIEAKVGFVTPAPLFSAPPSNPFRLMLLHENQTRLLWTDILAKKPGVGGAASIRA
jgi:hypothetical protein